MKYIHIYTLLLMSRPTVAEITNKGMIFGILEDDKEVFGSALLMGCIVMMEIPLPVLTVNLYRTLK